MTPEKERIPLESEFLWNEVIRPSAKGKDSGQYREGSLSVNTVEGKL